MNLCKGHGYSEKVAQSFFVPYLTRFTARFTFEFPRSHSAKVLLGANINHLLLDVSNTQSCRDLKRNGQFLMITSNVKLILSFNRSQY